MNSRTLLRLVTVMMAFAIGSAVSAAPVKKKKRERLPTAFVATPSGIVTYAYDERYQNQVDTVRTAYLAQPTGDAETWAGTVSAHVMSERVINYMEAKYTASESYAATGAVRNFVYFYGFDVSSQDLRGKFYGIDERKELEMRATMTKSLRGYMLGKGLMEYLKTMKFARPYVSTVENVQKASQFSVELKAAPLPGGGESTPWKFRTGPDLGTRTVFARANKGNWQFELRDSLSFNELTASVSNTYYRSYYSLRFFNASDSISPLYQYRFAKMWWANWSSDFPIAGASRELRIFNAVGVRHLF